MPSDRVIVYGAGDLGSSVRRIFAAAGVDVIGYVDDVYDRPSFEGVPLLGRGDELPALAAHHGAHAIVAIGYNHFARRAERFRTLKRAGVGFARCIHPSAIIDPGARVGDGVVIFAGAVVEHGAIIENNVLLNTAAAVAHDTRVREHCFVAPRAVLAGFVTVERCVMVGVGACVRERVRVGKGAIIGAGAVVLRDVDPFSVVAGVPARELRRVDSYDCGDDEDA